MEGIHILSFTLSLCFLPVTSLGTPSGLGSVLSCWYVEEGGGKGSFPTSIVQEPALLIFRHVPYQDGEETALPSDLELPPELKPGMFFVVRDDSRITTHPGLKEAADPRHKPYCELNKYSPQESSVKWATQLTEDERTPAYQSSSWYSSHLRTFDHSFSVASVHRITSGPRTAEEKSPQQTSVVLNVYTRTPTVRTELRRDVLLDCGFTMDRGTGFAVEWRYQFKGNGHLVYAYNGAKDRVDAAHEGTEMSFYELHSRGNASLLIRNVAMRHEGTYICTIYMPHLHAQQSIDLEISEVPRLTVSPDPPYLTPGQEDTLQCDISCYYPLDVSVSWSRKVPGGNGTVEPITESWQSGHRQNHDGTYNVSSYIAVRPGWAEHNTVYTCHVDHVSVRTTLRRSVTLKLAGFTGPSVNDAIGMFLCAFLLYAVLKLFYWIFTEKVYPLVCNPEQDDKEKRN